MTKTDIATLIYVSGLMAACYLVISIMQGRISALVADLKKDVVDKRFDDAKRNLEWYKELVDLEKQRKRKAILSRSLARKKPKGGHGPLIGKRA